MGSSHFGDLNLGNEQRSGGSSRKVKKSNSDKPKQPQRGLGVAQLEKIRLHGQMGSTHLHPPSFHNPYVPNLSQEDMRAQTGYSSSSSYSYSAQPSSSVVYPGNSSIMMGMNHIERANTGNEYSQLDPRRWSQGNAFMDAQLFPQQNMTRQLFDLQVEDSVERRRRKNKSRSSSQNSESSGDQEVDLELRLSVRSP